MADGDDGSYRDGKPGPGRRNSDDSIRVKPSEDDAHKKATEEKAAFDDAVVKYNELLGMLSSPSQESQADIIHAFLKQKNSKDQHLYLSAMFIHLQKCLQDWPVDAHAEKADVRRALEAWANILAKKINPTRLRDRVRYRRVPKSELADMAGLTFCMAFIANGRKPFAENTASERHPVFVGHIQTWGNFLVQKMSANCNCQKTRYIIGHLALIVLGAAMIVSAGCMTAVTYGSTSPFAVCVAKFGFEMMLVSASYVFYELMRAVGRGCAQQKMIKNSTKGVIIGLSGGTMAGAATAGATGIMHVLPRTAAVNSQMVPAMTAVTPVAVGAVVTGTVMMAFTGFVAMWRGMLFFQDARVRHQMRQHAMIVLQAKDDSSSTSYRPGNREV